MRGKHGYAMGFYEERQGERLRAKFGNYPIETLWRMERDEMLKAKFGNHPRAVLEQMWKEDWQRREGVI